MMPILNEIHSSYIRSPQHGQPYIDSISFSGEYTIYILWASLVCMARSLNGMLDLWLWAGPAQLGLFYQFQLWNEVEEAKKAVGEVKKCIMWKINIVWGVAHLLC